MGDEEMPDIATMDPDCLREYLQKLVLDKRAADKKAEAADKKAEAAEKKAEAAEKGKEAAEKILEKSKILYQLNVVSLRTLTHRPFDRSLHHGRWFSTAYKAHWKPRSLQQKQKALACPFHNESSVDERQRAHVSESTFKDTHRLEKRIQHGGQYCVFLSVSP